jgi:MFS family permease
MATNTAVHDRPPRPQPPRPEPPRRPGPARRPDPATPGRGARRAAPGLALLYPGCLLAAGAYGLTLLLPAFVKYAGGNAAQAGLIYWCGALGAGLALVFGGRLTERIGAPRAAVIGCGLYAVATALLALSSGVSASVYPAGALLGAGWATFFTSAPIIASSASSPERARSRFQVLAGFNALGMGSTPIIGQFLIGHGVSYRGIFALAALLSLGASALFWRLPGMLPRPGTSTAGTSTADGEKAGRGLAGPVRLVLTSDTRPFLLMVLLGACVFATMTAYQATFAASRGLSPAVFYACYTLGVIVPRFTVSRVLARCNPAVVTSALLAGMCLSLAGFLRVGHDSLIYGASSCLLGLTYGLAYPLIQGRAADSAPSGLRHWTLWYFSLAYFVGVYGFPLVAGIIIVLGGYQALLASLLVLAIAELAVSVGARRATRRGTPRPLTPPGKPETLPDRLHTLVIRTTVREVHPSFRHKWRSVDDSNCGADAGSAAGLPQRHRADDGRCAHD